MFFSMMSTWPYARLNQLFEAEVHLWFVSLAVTQEQSSYFWSILSREEQERAGSFHRRKGAQRYVASRGSLRSLLGGYLTVEPAQLQFAYNAFGKPHLATDVPGTGVSFSVSHSHDCGLLGFVREHSIGVDLERVDMEVDVESLAKRYFSPNEWEKLRLLPDDQRKQGFYRAWTRKEAYLKARGVGLSYELNQVEVNLAPGEPASLLGVRDDPNASAKWTLEDLAPARDYIGAAAVESRDITFKCFRYEAVP
jgi:4'-phosphopantetheinyl transferase